MPGAQDDWLELIGVQVYFASEAARDEFHSFIEDLGRSEANGYFRIEAHQMLVKGVGDAFIISLAFYGLRKALDPFVDAALERSGYKQAARRTVDRAFDKLEELRNQGKVNATTKTSMSDFVPTPVPVEDVKATVEDEVFRP